MEVKITYGGRGFELDIDCISEKDEKYLKRKLTKLWKTKGIDEIKAELINIKIPEGKDE